MGSITKTDDLALEICRALNLPANLCSRIIIDLKYDEPIRVYVQFYGTTELLEIDWLDAALEGVEVIKVGEAE
jgi:hypothetical protein